MKLEQSFEVDAPVSEVWAALIDIQRVAPCLPGAEITEVSDDGTYSGDFKVKLGPTTAAYRGTLKMEELDEEAHVATMRANGQDKRGQGSAKALIVSRMTETDGVTRVDVDTDFTITGKLARFGRGGMIKDISNRLLGEFASCLQAGFAGSGHEGGGPDGEEAAAAAGSAPSPEDDPAVPPTAATVTAAVSDAGAEPTPAVPAPEAPDEPLAAAAGGMGPVASPPSAPASPSTPPPRPSFSPPAAAKPIGGVGLVGSVLLGRLAPFLLPVVRALRQGLERLERLLGQKA